MLGVEEIITYLEMTAPGELIPALPVTGVRLTAVDATSSHLRRVHVEVGAPYGWRSSSRTDEDWTVYLADPLRRYWLVEREREGEVAGIVGLRLQPERVVEITTFGLLPEFVGRGLGGHALTLALRQAWAVEPLGGGPVARVWLHTSTRDHPNALRNYQRRGLRPYRTETRQYQP